MVEELDFLGHKPSTSSRVERERSGPDFAILGIGYARGAIRDPPNAQWGNDQRATCGAIVRNRDILYYRCESHSHKKKSKSKIFNDFYRRLLVSDDTPVANRMNDDSKRAHPKRHAEPLEEREDDEQHREEARERGAPALEED